MRIILTCAFTLIFIALFADNNKVGLIIEQAIEKDQKYKVRSFEIGYPNDSLLKKEKRFYGTFSVPYVNSFLLNPIGESIKVNTGFLGVSMGLEYHFKHNNFLSAKINAASDFFVPIPASPGIDGEYESMNSVYFSISHNRQVLKSPKLFYGYGFNYALNNWRIRDYSQTPTLTLQEYAGQSIGIDASIYYKLFWSIYAGLIYRPSILRVSPNVGFVYEHLLSLDFAIKF